MNFGKIFAFLVIALLVIAGQTEASKLSKALKKIGHAGSKVVSGIEKGAEVVGTVCGLITC
ncbi:cecropin-B1-like [Hermetia illucens]|uniref:cecropin-B1-like n=1 Tax=Hermetia illucens TaxID=343691 RepID=UPI0018CC3F38|nr:cecropin-B1-like [Hermetia illucens]